MADRLYMYNWYHGETDRKVAEGILKNQRAGFYLVRDSRTQKGDYVLSVSENSRVSHYIINQRNGKYTIGDQTFDDLPDIIEFYKRHLLDTTTLVEVAARPQVEKAPPPLPTVPTEVRVKAKHNFPGNDPDDLAFRKNDVLTIVRKEEDQWWLARDSTGKEGMIPANYVEELRNSVTLPTRHSQAGIPDGPKTIPPPSTTPKISVPAIAEAIQARQPNVYDPSELKFMPGDQILVLKMVDNGSWEGQLKDGKKGIFPFTYVKLITSDTAQVEQFKSQISST